MFGCALVFGTALLYWIQIIMPSSVYTIGLVYVPSRSYHEHFAHKLQALVGLDKRFKIVEFSVAAADQMLVASVCSTALNRKDVDVFVCVGLVCSQTMVNVSKKREGQKPIVFMGVDDPVGLGLVNSLAMPGHNVTGIFTRPCVEGVSPLLLLQLAKPSVKNVLLPYAVVADGNESRANAIRELGLRHGIIVHLLPIDNIAETMLRVSDQISGNDSLIYIEGDLLGSYGAGFGKLCSQHGVTMFASSLDGISNALLSYSIDPARYAASVLALIIKILINHESPGHIPVQEADGTRDFRINTHLSIEQGVSNLDLHLIEKNINGQPIFSAIRNNLIIKSGRE